MAVTQFHITNEDSGSFPFATPFNEVGPGNLIMDADAWLVSAPSTIAMSGFDQIWTATINGKVTSSDFSGGGNAAIFTQLKHASIVIGASAEVTGYTWGIFSDLGGTDIINKGRIVSQSATGYAIQETFTGGDYTINNSGEIIAAFHAIDLTWSTGGGSGGIHTIINSGTIEAPVAIVSLNNFVIERVTNRGVITGDIDLGGDNDTFTDFAKVKVHGKFVTKHGTVNGTIDLGIGSDTFKGGNNAENVQDGGGADIYKLSGGNDTLLAANDTGSDGVDTIDGGVGRDTYDASAVATGLQINLDTKAHGGIAANSVVASGQTDHIFNFEDVIGSVQSDTIYGNAAANHLVGGEGTDELFGLGGNDTLEGGSSSDHLYGGAGRDILSGSVSSGSAPIDTFHFQSLSDSGVTAATRDVVTDFKKYNQGLIDLSEIDANKGTAANDDFTFIGLSKWHGVAGELRYVWTATQTIVEADVNGDAKVDFSIALDGHHTLTVADFDGVLP